ncbi:MAG: hypothetical protein ACRCXB_00155 [Aeromonadaceae bacterium]
MWFVIKAALAITILAFLLLILICAPYYTGQFFEKFREDLTKGKPRAKRAAASKRNIRF